MPKDCCNVVGCTRTAEREYAHRDGEKRQLCSRCWGHLKLIAPELALRYVPLDASYPSDLADRAVEAGSPR